MGLTVSTNLDAVSAFKVRDGIKVLCADWRWGLVGVGGEGGLEVLVDEDKIFDHPS